jgi:hypothetical protein
MDRILTERELSVIQSETARRTFELQQSSNGRPDPTKMDEIFTENKCNILKAQDAKSTAALIAWLNEPCDEHPTKPDGINPVKWISSCLYKAHRKDCPQCWQSLKQSLEVKE